MHYNILFGLLIILSLVGCSGPAPRMAPADEAIQAQKPVVTGKSIAVLPYTPVQRATPEQSEMLFRVLSSIGVDYTYGGASHATGFDCSGLVAHVFREGYGIILPRNSYDQSQVGRPVMADELLPGDLVFYNTLARPFSHVGIYLGDGRFIHAPKTGSAVRIESLKSGYWSKRWNGARRVATNL